MRLAGLRSDLGLLAGAVADPVGRWRSWRGLAIELYRDGGATIDTPPAPLHGRVGATTVIQPDGDVLLFVDEGSLLDSELLVAHGLRVRAWYERSTATIREAAVVLRAAAGAGGLALASACGLALDSLVNRAVGLASFAAVSTVGSWLLGLVVRLVFRRGIDKALRRRVTAA